MEDEKIDEKILELTDILNDLTTNAIGLSKDLVEGINAIHLTSYFWFIGAIIMYFIGSVYGWGYQTILIPIVMIANGIFTIWRFRTLKSKYSGIYELREQLETMKR